LSEVGIGTKLAEIFGTVNFGKGIGNVPTINRRISNEGKNVPLSREVKNSIDILFS